MYFRRSDRRYLILFFIVGLALWAGVVLDRWLLQPRESEELVRIEELADSIRTAPEKPSSVSAQTGGNRGGLYLPETFVFDPNTADSATLVRLGLAPWQAKAMLHYRERGGRYHRSSDFKKVPGMTPELYERLAPVISIGRQFRYYEDLDETDAIEAVERERHRVRDSVHQRRSDSIAALGRPQKFRDIVILELNTVDSLTLQRIPGIGPLRAQKIVEYRDRLGGFYSVSQLAEIQAVPNEVAPWLRVDKELVKKLNVNTMSVAELARHPYMGFARAKAIAEYRRTHGRIVGAAVLAFLPEFTEASLERLKPYLEY
ncbi:MAG: helix-hairpin-helix domain-containing protein [Bacteroidaceae bacterium]|nr:helix-hairpin-helix domain-containing protein [Bacteroidaceae bacterium]